MITVHPAGARRHIQPLAYPALAGLFSDILRLTDAPDTADMILFAHPRDLVSARVEMFGLLRHRPDTRIVLLSEEPFWDTVGVIPPFQRQQNLKTPDGPLPFTFLNHHTSRIFDFAEIPYFLLTQPHFLPRYGLRFRRNRGMSRGDWAQHFAATPLQAVFMAERRMSDKVDANFPKHDVKGLSLWRTELAEAYQTGPALRAGKGWDAGSPDRSSLPDWHLEKLLQLDRQSRFVSAIENTHQNAYVSEKIFDAFAVGSVPLYYAGPNHRIHHILPAPWVNLYQTTPAEACARIDALTFDAEVLDRYSATQTALADRCTNSTLLLAERDQLRARLHAELQSVMNSAA